MVLLLEYNIFVLFPPLTTSMDYNPAKDHELPFCTK